VRRLRSARLPQGDALQRRLVQQTLIRPDDRNARDVSVVHNQAGWRCAARKPKRQENAERLAWPDFIGEQSRRSGSAG
jgi:hypothetical protein